MLSESFLEQGVVTGLAAGLRSALSPKLQITS
jgi:hypothetical protein